MKYLWLHIIFGLLMQAANAQTAGVTQTIKGNIIDDQSGSKLTGATIQLDFNGTALMSISDSTGWFRLKEVPIGRRNIKVSMSGYEPVYLSNIEVTSSKEVVLEIRLKEKIQKLNELVLARYQAS
jgi:hypothetical protein